MKNPVIQAASRTQAVYQGAFHRVVTADGASGALGDAKQVQMLVCSKGNGGVDLPVVGRVHHGLQVTRQMGEGGIQRDIVSRKIMGSGLKQEVGGAEELAKNCEENW